MKDDLQRLDIRISFIFGFVIGLTVAVFLSAILATIEEQCPKGIKDGPVILKKSEKTR